MKRTTLFALAICFAAGCGGGGKGGTQSTGAGQTASVGGASVTYFGTPQPQVTATSGSVTVAGQAGATFSAVTVSPTPSLSNTFLAFSRTNNGTSEVFSVPYTGGQQQLLTHNVEGDTDPAISKYGVIIYNQLIGLYAETMRSDGSNQAALSISGPAYYLYPSVSPSGATIAIGGGGEELWTAPITGGTATLIESNDDGLGTCWNPAGNQIAHVASNGSGYENIYTLANTGGSQSDVTSYEISDSGNTEFPSWSSDGVSMSATYTPTGSSKSQAIVFAINTSTYIDITPSTYSDTYATFAPDGVHLAFYRSSVGGATPGIYISDYSGSNQYLVLPDESGDGAVNSLAWSPYPVPEKLLGTSSNLWNSNVNGFLVSQSGQQFGSIVGFTTTTPADATITAPSATTGGQPLIFTLGGDKITEIAYANSFYAYNTQNRIIPTTTTPTALVTIDAGTGQVDTIATAAAKPAATSVGGNLVYTGKFSGIYDSQAKNLAPKGASQLTVNPKTGKLVSFR